MGQTNPCLRRTFTFFNVLFAIIGALIILLALLSQGYQRSHNVEQVNVYLVGHVLLYVIGSVTMVIGVLGACGAQKESRPALIVFLVCMVIGTIIMLRTVIPLAVARPQLEEAVERRLQVYLPLDKAPEEIRRMADKFQETFSCCGLFSYQDWQDIPASCLCDPDLGQHCRIVKYKNLMMSFVKSSSSIYNKTCFPIMWYYLSLAYDAMLGVCLALAILAILGLVLSSVMLHQIRSVSRAPVLLSVPAIFSPQPPKYHELYDNKA